MNYSPSNKRQFYFNADGVNHSQFITIEDETFNQRIFDDGKIYGNYLFVEKITGTAWALCIPYRQENNDSSRRDNIGKAKGLAKYAEKILCTATNNELDSTFEECFNQFQ